MVPDTSNLSDLRLVVYGNQIDLRKTKLRKFIENMENNPAVAGLFVSGASECA